MDRFAQVPETRAPSVLFIPLLPLFCLMTSIVVTRFVVTVTTPCPINNVVTAQHDLSSPELPFRFVSCTLTTRRRVRCAHRRHAIPRYLADRHIMRHDVTHYRVFSPLTKAASSRKAIRPYCVSVLFDIMNKTPGPRSTAVRTALYSRAAAHLPP